MGMGRWVVGWFMGEMRERKKWAGGWTLELSILRLFLGFVFGSRSRGDPSLGILRVAFLARVEHCLELRAKCAQQNKTSQFLE